MSRTSSFPILQESVCPRHKSVPQILTIMRILLLLSATLALTSAVNREQNGAANSPVYSPSTAYQGKPANVGPNQDHQAAASGTSYSGMNPAGTSPGNSNTYYYFYPQGQGQGDMKNEHQYQGAASNQYTASINPNGDHGVAHEPVGASTDLSYSHEMGSMNQGLHDQGQQGGGGAAGVNSAYDISNLAAQYASLTGNQGGQAAGGPGAFPNAAFNGNPAYPTGNSFENQPGYHGNAGGENAFSASSPVAGYHGQPLGYVPGGPQGSFQYGGQHFGNYAAGSSQSNSYEPSTGSRFGKYGLGSIIMPMLALAGLSLLIPTVTSLSGLSSSSSSSASSRRKRSTEGEKGYEQGIGGVIDRLDRYYSIFKTAMDKPDCMDRLICQLGDSMSDVKHKESYLKLLEMIPMPSSWKDSKDNKVKVLKKGALGNHYSKCKQYTC